MSLRNGLPSKYTYRTLVDHNGYLWIATDKGVVKYNGYEAKVFSMLNGLNNDDVWQIFEDKKGRIWLSTISDDIGYIYNDQYHKVYMKTPTMMYPSHYTDYKDGVVFLSGRGPEIYLCIEKNDSLTTYLLRNDNNKKISSRFITPDLHYIKYVPEGDFYDVVFTPNTIRYKKLASLFLHANNKIEIIGQFVFLFRKPHYNDTLYNIYNLKTKVSRNLKLGVNEEILTAINMGEDLYLTTTHNVFRLDKNINTLSRISSTSLNIETSNTIGLSTFLDNKIWGRSISTNNFGVFIQPDQQDIAKHFPPLAKGSLVGNYRDSLYYFWDNTNKTLSEMAGNGRLYRSKRYDEINFINKIIHYAPDSALVLASDFVYILSGQRMYSFDAPITNFYEVVNHKKYKQQPYLYTNSYFKSRLANCIIDSTRAFHAVSMGNGGCSLFWINGSKYILKMLDKGRYVNLIYYRLLCCYIYYGKDRILIEKGDRLIKLDKTLLYHYGITEIKQIQSDSIGNIFIKSNENLFVFNPFKGTYKRLFNNLNLTNANIHLYKDKVLAVGRFGVTISKISYLEGISTPSTFVNFKSFNYTYITSSYIMGNDLYIESDKGACSFALDDTGFNNNLKYNFKCPYRLHISTNDHNRTLYLVDTIIQNQDNTNLNWDFINPYGDGSVKYTYNLDGDTSYSKIFANQVDLPNLSPGKYHKMKLIISDDSWISDKYILYLYVKPYWWQTSTGKTWLIMLSIIAATAIGITIVFTTKFILNKKHAKENKYLELELKSIYAQLNPHFIFNTLSNIIYYIKKNKNQEAHKYLNTFSKLLRSYIKSSRNKWLPLAEEIENIENYIVLQQSRFENKFDYTINIDEGLDTENIQLPSLLLQPLVENAIHHGLQQKSEKGNLTLSFKKTNDNNTIVIAIEDDGIGRIKAKEFAKHSLNKKESFGSNLIEDLITIYKRYELFSIDIDYYDKTEPLTGTLVTLTIKYEP